MTFETAMMLVGVGCVLLIFGAILWMIENPPQ